MQVVNHKRERRYVDSTGEVKIESKYFLDGFELSTIKAFLYIKNTQDIRSLIAIRKILDDLPCVLLNEVKSRPATEEEKSSTFEQVFPR